MKILFKLFADKFISSIPVISFMDRGERVLEIANKIVDQLKPFCIKIEIVGSIRRKKSNPRDIDLVLIAKKKEYKLKMKELLSKEGKFLQGGDKEMFFRVEGIDLQLFFTVVDEWGAALLAYSGKKVLILG